MAYIKVTGPMVGAAREAFLRHSRGPVPTGDVVVMMLRAALDAAEIAVESTPVGPVTVHFTDHHGDRESVKVPIDGPGHDFGPQGLAFRKVQVSTR